MGLAARSHISATVIAIPAVVCLAASWVHHAYAVDWKQPLNWIPDRFKPPWMGGEPNWQRILIWDENLGLKRGVRVGLMPVVKDEQNVPIDRRLTIQMKGYMLTFCDQVITVLDIDDPQLRDRLDYILNTCIDQWKQRGRIDPKTVEPILSDLPLDAVFLFERTLYDQDWRGDRKIFRIGILGAAFAVDSGDMIFLDDVVEESPWWGMQNTVARVERLAIRSLLDKFYNRLQQISRQLDAARAAAIERARKAAQEQERRRLAQLAREEEEIRHLTQEAAAVLLSATQPPDLMARIRQVREQLTDSLRKPASEQSDAELEERRRAADELRTFLDRYRKYQAERERLRAFPPPRGPVEQPVSQEPAGEDLPIDSPGPSLPPKATPTPAVIDISDLVPPGLLDLPPPRTRRPPLPPLQPTLPTPTPVVISPPTSSLSGSPVSSTPALVSPATAGIPLPTSPTATGQPRAASGAVLRPVTPETQTSGNVSSENRQASNDT